MSDKLSTAEVLTRLVERVRRIENDAGQVAGVLDKMIEKIEARAAASTSSRPNVPSDKLVAMLTKKKASHE